jgi:hypothetical protein
MASAPDGARVPGTAVIVISKIETVVESIIDALLAKQPISISIRMKKTPKATSPSVVAPDFKPWREMAVSFPGKTNDESRRFGKGNKTSIIECRERVTGGWGLEANMLTWSGR